MPVVTLYLSIMQQYDENNLRITTTWYGSIVVRYSMYSELVCRYAALYGHGSVLCLELSVLCCGHYLATLHLTLTPKASQPPQTPPHIKTKHVINNLSFRVKTFDSAFRTADCMKQN